MIDTEVSAAGISCLPQEAMGLKALNPQSFEKMAQSGHRVVSIIPDTPSSFSVRTECSSGVKDYMGKACQGFMNFALKERGVSLCLGVFNHHQECAEKTGSDLLSLPIENVHVNFENFKASWQEILGSAKQCAEKYKSAEQNQYGASVNSLLDGITGLESQSKKYFRSLEDS